MTDTPRGEESVVDAGRLPPMKVLNGYVCVPGGSMSSDDGDSKSSQFSEQTVYSEMLDGR